MAQWVRYLDYLITHTSLSPIRRGFAPGCVNYTTKTGRHDIAEILLKVALNTNLKKINLTQLHASLFITRAKYISGNNRMGSYYHTPSHTYAWQLSILATKSGGVKLVSWDHIPLPREMMWSCKSFSHANKMPTPSHITRWAVLL